MNATHHKITNLLKTLRHFCDYVSQCICVVQTILLPVRPRGINRLDTPGTICTNKYQSGAFSKVRPAASQTHAQRQRSVDRSMSVQALGQPAGSQAWEEG